MEVRTGGSRTLTLALLAGAAALFVAVLRTSRVVIDDAFISFRYLDHWLAGHGLVFNVGERLEGYTNFLWIVALAPLRVAGLSPETASLVLSVAAVVALLWAVHGAATALSGNALAGAFALILALSSASLAFYTGSGMETVFFAALIALANGQLAQRGGITPLAAFLFGLATLTRPDGVLFAGAAFLAFSVPSASGVPGGMRALLRAVAAYAILPIMHLLFRLSYYGEWLPNTFYAKATGIEADLLTLGLDYLAGFLRSGGVVPAVAAALAVFSRAARNRTGAALTIQVILQSGYTAWVGGDSFPLTRFLLPLLPCLAVLGGVGILGLLQRGKVVERWWAPAVILPLAIAATSLDHLTYSKGSVAILRANKAEREEMAAWISRRFPDAKSLAVNAAGVIPYRTGLPAIDMLGLADRHIARAKVATSEEGNRFAGHFKHDGHYVLSRAPDVVVMSSGTLWNGRDPKEAIRMVGKTAFTGDRELFKEAEEKKSYRIFAEEVLPGEYAVVLLRSEFFRSSGAADPRALQNRGGGGSTRLPSPL